MLKTNTQQDISSFTFPDKWQDSAEMQMLFSIFRPRHLNTEDYDIKMKFWKDLITHYCKFHRKCSFSLQELQLQFMRGEQVPACLNTVIQEMHEQKLLRLLSIYEYDSSISWSSWLISSLVQRPLSWGWQRLKNSIVPESLDRNLSMEWVHLEVLQNICNEIIEKVLHKNRGKLLHFDGFKDLCKDSNISTATDRDLTTCVHHLNTQNLIGLEFTMKEATRCIHLIKIPADNKDKHNLVISEADHAMHNLQMTQANLLQQLETLEVNIKFNDDKVRQYLKENKRQMAKTYLRKRHLLEKNHERRSIALHNIESLQLSVDEAQNSGVVLDAYKIGSKTLQKVLTDSGLKYDNVDEILADVRDTMDQHKEVQDVMSNTAALQDEDLDLEKELTDLLDESKEERRKTTPPAKTNNNSDKVEVLISDEDMLAMLDELSIEEGSIGEQAVRLKKLHT
ncbi:LOW QUALITY PROTEIN: charged multivesicular body protein 7 [Drosophila tropicalis]|uniref:LOW QUALITY PROTEIN: charged multivesicular body protein 7 n=1 Tax=Drosophila tropicalis TaxID=46794 RepID=UPI0035ABECB2